MFNALEWRHSGERGNERAWQIIVLDAVNLIESASFLLDPHWPDQCCTAYATWPSHGGCLSTYHVPALRRELAIVGSFFVAPPSSSYRDLLNARTVSQSTCVRDTFLASRVTRV
jgi:hypothetical protein